MLRRRHQRLTDLVPVGSKPAGDGVFGQSDLGGNVWEWVLDWYATPYANPCNDCANLTPASARVIRGGSFDNVAALEPARPVVDALRELEAERQRHFDALTVLEKRLRDLTKGDVAHHHLPLPNALPAEDPRPPLPRSRTHGASIITRLLVSADSQESPRMSTRWQCWAKRSTRATTQASPGNVVPHCLKPRLVVMIVERCSWRRPIML